MAQLRQWQAIRDERWLTTDYTDCTDEEVICESIGP